MQEGHGSDSMEMRDAASRVEALLNMTSSIRLPNVGTRPSITVPFHMAGLMKRFVVAAKIGVPREKISADLDMHLGYGYITKDARDWLVELFRLHSQSRLNGTTLGTEPSTGVETKDTPINIIEIANMLLGVSSPANWCLQIFFDFLVEELSLMKRKLDAKFEGKMYDQKEDAIDEHQAETRLKRLRVCH